MFPLGLYNYFEILAFAVSVAFWKRLKTSKLRIFMPYLLFIVIIELAGRYLVIDLKKNVGWMFNISVPVEYFFFTYLYYQNYKSFLYKKVAAVFLIFFPVFVGIHISLYSLSVFHTLYLKIGSCAMIVLSCFYLADILQTDLIVNPVAIPMFWIASGVLLFNAGELINNFLMDLLLNDMPRWSKVFKLINNNLIVVLYSCISVALILVSWGHRQIT